MKNAFLIAGATCAILAFASLQNQSLYNGQPLSETGITLTSWGGGKISEAKDVSLAGGSALKVETTNFFQGGMIQWPKPIDVSSASQSKDSLLGIGVWIVIPAGAEGGGAVGGGGDPSGGGNKFGSGGASVGSIGGGQASGGAGAKPQLRMGRLRIVIKTSDGKLSEAIAPVNASGRWVRTSIPIDRIPGFAKSNRQIAAMAISGDAPAYFYIGEIRVTTDQTPIQGSINNTDLNIGKGTEVILSANAEAGLTPVEFVWDFDAKDGLQEEAWGQAIRHKFRIPGDFVVTLTIRDPYGLKKPWTGTMRVTVNP